MCWPWLNVMCLTCGTYLELFLKAKLSLLWYVHMFYLLSHLNLLMSLSAAEVTSCSSSGKAQVRSVSTARALVSYDQGSPEKMPQHRKKRAHMSVTVTTGQ